jgi:catechol 2,3-dioxygenase-like lactoylglutathione lyase family enzyme
MIGRLHHIVLDCPDVAALAAFYAELLGQPVTYRSDDWVVVACLIRRPEWAPAIPAER